MTIKEKIREIIKIIKSEKKQKTSEFKVVSCKKCMCPLFPDEIMCPDCLTPSPKR